MIETRVFSDKQSPFAKFLFPMFRGSLLLYLYFLLYGINVYVWEKYNINYRLLFDIQLSYSSAYQIMKRAFGFLLFWMIIFSYCALTETLYFRNSAIFVESAAKYIAPTCWLAFFVYMFMPSRRIFNYEGRIFLLKAVKNFFRAPFENISFFTDFAIS